MHPGSFRRLTWPEKFASTARWTISRQVCFVQVLLCSCAGRRKIQTNVHQQTGAPWISNRDVI
jgi:hypothetical protein